MEIVTTIVGSSFGRDETVNAISSPSGSSGLPQNSHVLLVWCPLKHIPSATFPFTTSDNCAARIMSSVACFPTMCIKRALMSPNASYHVSKPPGHMRHLSLSLGYQRVQSSTVLLFFFVFLMWWNINGAWLQLCGSCTFLNTLTLSLVLLICCN